jgi:hypothetical protein
MHDVDLLAVDVERDVAREGDDRQRLARLGLATISAPALPKFSLPPVWSKCQCVLSTNRTGFAVSLAIAASILGVSGANWSSTRNTASSPTERPMLPPAPASM